MTTFDWPGEKLLIRVWETAEKSYIGLARPWLMKREGTAKAAADYRNKLALAQAEIDLEEVKAGRAKYDAATGKLVPLLRPLPTLPEFGPMSNTPALPALEPLAARPIPRLGSALDFATHTLLQSTVKEMERTINLERTLQKAETEAVRVQDTEVLDIAPSADWVAKWREGAQDVTIDQIQLLWARLLTGEARRPGSFSLRTLDFIKSVSVEEATLIERLSALAISGSMVFKEEKLLLSRGFHFHTLLSLQALGVLSGAESGLHWLLSPDSNAGPSGFAHYDFHIRWEKIPREIQVPCYALTPLGSELLRLGNYKGDREYFRAVAAHLGRSGVRCVLTYAPPTEENADSLAKEEWFGPVDVEEQPQTTAQP